MYLVNGAYAADPASRSQAGQAAAEIVLSFVEWGQGLLPIEQALLRTASCFGAAGTSLTRVRLKGLQSRVVAVAATPGVQLHKHQSLAGRVIGTQVDQLKIGVPVLMSCLEDTRLLRDADAEAWKSDNGILDVGFICLSRGAHEADYLELYFRDPPEAAWDADADWSAAALARAYEFRLPGLVTEALARSSADADRQFGDGTPILAARNVAGLTRTEFKVCVLVSRGLAAKSVAAEMSVSTATVRSHLRNIYAKTGLWGYHQLARRLVSREEQDALHHPVRMSA